jgi:hypothetical protein
MQTARNLIAAALGVLLLGWEKVWVLEKTASTALSGLGAAATVALLEC